MVVVGVVAVGGGVVVAGDVVVPSSAPAYGAAASMTDAATPATPQAEKAAIVAPRFTVSV